MSLVTRDILNVMRRVVYDETKFLRHYAGKVLDNEDPDTKGRVKCQVLDLGWGINGAADDSTTGAWCWPRAIHSMDIPKVGEWVEVYFMSGDRNRPVYIGQLAEMTGQLPEGYSQGLRVLMQDPDTGDSDIYDTDEKARTIDVQDTTIKMDANGIELNGDGERLTIYSKLNTAIGNLASSINSAISGAIVGHTHVITTAPGTSAPGVGSAPSVTADISASETTTIKTGG
jgi:hypothetical protein